MEGIKCQSFNVAHVLFADGLGVVLVGDLGWEHGQFDTPALGDDVGNGLEFLHVHRDLIARQWTRDEGGNIARGDLRT